MTEEIIKEQLSNNFIKALAYCKGYMLTKPELDYGVDLVLSGTSKRTELSGEVRYMKNNQDIEIQMKSTTFARVALHPDFIGYSFEAKNYNDLVIVNNIWKSIVPRILVLFILPVEREKWVEVDEASLILRHSAYWYKPDETDGLTSNSSTKKVNIPRVNRFAVDTWPDLIAQFYPK